MAAGSESICQVSVESVLHRKETYFYAQVVVKEVLHAKFNPFLVAENNSEFVGHLSTEKGLKAFLNNSVKAERREVQAWASERVSYPKLDKFLFRPM